MNDPVDVDPVEIPKPSIPRPYIPPPVVIPTPPVPPHFSPETAVPESEVNPGPVEDEVEESAEKGTNVAFNTRVIAAVIDLVVASGLLLGMSFILPEMADRLAWLIGAAYMVTRDSLPFLKGQSVGKKAMKIKVLTTDGQSLEGNWSVALIRNGILLIPLLPLLELYILLTREGKMDQGLRLGDEWANTRVVSLMASPQI
jgi:uncharacterized RDD family membrane protein YckC